MNAATTTPPVLALAGIAKAFATPQGPLTVLRQVDLCVQPDDFVLLTGPSGSGKSTLLSLAGLLDTPTAGTITFAGQRLDPRDDEHRRRLRADAIGFVFQRFHLLPTRSVLDNVLFRFRYLAHDSAAARARARDLLGAFGLAAVAARPAHLLSAGEMQRVAIARAVVHPPRLLLADEPTGNLDDAAAAAVMDCFRRLHAQGIPIVLATHNLAWRTHATRHLRCAAGTVEEAA